MRTREFKLTRVSKNGGTHFEHVWLSSRSDYNCGCEIILPHDPRSSSTQSQAGKGAGLGIGFGSGIGAINRA